MTDQEFPAGHIFFRPGDPGDRAYLLLDGQVEVLAGAAESYTRIGLFGSGDVFGEMALIEERPRSLTARAVTTSRVTPMTREEFEHQLMHDPVHARHYLRSLFERLRSLTARLGSEVEALRDEETTSPTSSEEISHPGPIELPMSLGDSAKWVVVIHPLTRKAAETLPDDGLLVTRFPLRIGRATAAHEKEALDLNDLWLLDEKPYNISRNHCEIFVDDKGPVLRDRGSQLGCHVNDEWIGGRAIMGYARLTAGDNVVVIGSRMSPYQFRVTVRSA